MNIDKDLSKNDMKLNDDIFYIFMDASCQLMRDDGILPWRGPRDKHPLFYQIMIDAFSKSKGIVADLTATTSRKHFVFALKFYFNVFFTTKMLSFVILLIIVYYLFDKALHTCLPRLETSPCDIGRW